MASVIPKTKDSPMRRNQTSKVMMAAMSATNVRMPAARSAIFCDLGFVARASLMSCFICPTVECSPTLARVMVRAPSTQIEPAVTLSPCFFEIGFDSPLMSDSSTLAPPSDCTVSEGGASVDESLISGESKPISKKQGDKVTAGSICVDGALTITLARVGEHSTVGQIKQLIKDARATKPRSQKIADRAAGILTFVALIAAIITLLVWFLLMGESFVFGITLAITVLVIACPHALGLAIP